MFQYLKRLLRPEKCAICNSNPSSPAMYYNDLGQKVKVCYKCVPYAERRAYRKI